MSPRDAGIPLPPTKPATPVRSSLTSGILSPTSSASAASMATRGLAAPVTATRGTGSSMYASNVPSSGVGGARSPSISYTSRPTSLVGGGGSRAGRSLTMDRLNQLEPMSRGATSKALSEPLLDDNYYARTDMDVRCVVGCMSL